MYRLLLITTVFLVSLLLCHNASGQQAASWSASLEQGAAKQGAGINVRVTARINTGWHVYSTTPHDEGPVATGIEFSKSSPCAYPGKSGNRNP